MKPEAQRIAIAEACGWTQIRPMIDDTGDWVYGVHYADKDHPCAGKGGAIPEYTSSLNAMHSAEQILNGVQCKAFDSWLTRIVARTQMDTPRVGACANFQWNATAAQRAEAFLRTLSLWKDGGE